MDHKILRTLMLMGAVILGYGLVMRSDTPVEAIGMIVLVALLLLSMENVKRKKDKIFETHTQIDAVDDMDRADFVAYTSHLYKRLGYYIQGIKTLEDKGCDLVIAHKGARICVYAENQLELITADVVEKLYESRLHYHCKQCLVITNQCLSEDAEAFAQAHEIQVVGRESLIQLMHQILRSEDETHTREESSGSMA